MQSFQVENSHGLPNLQAVKPKGEQWGEKAMAKTYFQRAENPNVYIHMLQFSKWLELMLWSVKHKFT